MHITEAQRFNTTSSDPTNLVAGQVADAKRKANLQLGRGLRRRYRDEAIMEKLEDEYEKSNILYDERIRNNSRQQLVNLKWQIEKQVTFQTNKSLNLYLFTDMNLL